MKSFLQHLQENEDPQTFTTTRREVMYNRGMGPEYIEKIKKYRADPKNAELLSPFALPSVEDKDLDRPVKINYGPPGSFPDDPAPAYTKTGAGGRPVAGFAFGGNVRIHSPVISDFTMGEFKGKQELLDPSTNKSVTVTHAKVPNVGQTPVTTVNWSTGKPVQAISRYPDLADPPYDIIGHEVVHTAQPLIDKNQKPQQVRVVGPLPGDTPENEQYRNYLFNTLEPAARANEHKAWLKARGLNIDPDMSPEDFKKAMDELRRANETNPRPDNEAYIEFYNTQQGEVLFRGAKANTDKDDPTKNKPVTTPSMPTAIAEHWSRMAKKL